MLREHELTGRMTAGREVLPIARENVNCLFIECSSNFLEGPLGRFRSSYDREDWVSLSGMLHFKTTTRITFLSDQVDHRILIYEAYPLPTTFANASHQVTTPHPSLPGSGGIQ